MEVGLLLNLQDSKQSKNLKDMHFSCVTGCATAHEGLLRK